MPQHDLISKLRDEMAERVENGVSYKIDKKELNVLKKIISFTKISFQMMAIIPNTNCFLGCHTFRQN